MPLGKMAAIIEITASDQITVGKQHRKLLFIGTNGGGVQRHDIGTILKIGDAPEPFGLALGAKVTT